MKSNFISLAALVCLSVFFQSCKDNKEEPKAAPTISTTSLTSVTTTGATGGGTIAGNGGAPVTESGVCFGTSAAPTTAGSKVATSPAATDGAFTVSISGLKAATTYYVRAYAINSVGTSYGNEVTFQTISNKAPSLTTATPSAVTAEGADVGGNISSNGGETITESGICYATTAAPTTGSSKLATNPVVTSGEYKISLKELIVGTKYYLRAYAINSIGTTYGAEVTFTTLTKAPTLTTTSASNVTISSATVGGNISSNGGAAVTESGVCYGTTTLPAASNSKVATNPLVSTGAFTASLSGLTNATTYYVRAYAINPKLCRI